jgi:HK97 family phage portal protein
VGFRRILADWLLKGADIGGRVVQSFQSGRPYHPDVSHAALVKKYTSWVYACANKNAIACAQVPLRLYAAKPTRGSKAIFPTRAVPEEKLKYLRGLRSVQPYLAKAVEIEEVLEHPFLTLMAEVNEFMNGFDLMEGMFLSQELTGNAYWQIVTNGTGLPSEIWPLMPQFVKIVPDKQKFISHFEFSVNMSEKYNLEPEEVIQFKYPNPDNAFYGLSPLQACVVAADLGVSMNQYEVGLMQNRAMPEFALSYPEDAGTMKEEERKRIQKDWNKRFRGAKKAGKMTILTGGAKLEPLSLSPKEMNFLQGRKWTLTEISAVYGVPESMLKTETVNRANADAGEYAHKKNTVHPRLLRVEQKFNEQLLPRYDDRLFCAFDNPVPEDKEYRLKETESHLKTGYSTINQERQVDGLEEVEWGDKPILPFNLAPLGTATLPAGGTGQPEKVIKSPRRMPPLAHPTNFVNREFEKAIQEYYHDVGVAILESFDKDADAFKRYQPIQKDRAADFVNGWFDMQRWNRELATKKDPFVRATFMAGGERALRSVTAEQMFDPLNPKVEASLAKHRSGSVQSINSSIVRGLRVDLGAGLAEGEAAAVLRKRVALHFENLEKYAAVRIARTEAIWGWNEGAVQGYIQSGVVHKKVWVSSGDSRTCDFCPTLDGKVIEVDVDYFGKGETLEVGDKSLYFEYENIGHPPLHPNCRCAIAPEIEEI